MRAVKDYDVKRLVVAGGVSANKRIRNKLKELCEQEQVDLTVPDLKYCTDNASMIGAAGYFAYKHGITSDLRLSAVPGINLV